MATATLERIVGGVTAVGVLGLAAFLLVNHADSAGPVTGSVDRLQDTEIVAHPDVPLSPDKNVIWCGTMALAWNEAIAAFKVPLLFAPSIPLADSLNKQEFTKSDLDAESYAVMAGRKVDGVEGKFRDELQHKFGDAARPPKLDQADSPATADDVAIYAYLLKNLAFPDPFNNNVALSFQGIKVADFGFGFENVGSSGVSSKLLSEVKLLAYTSDDNFVIQLKTKNDGDQLILAKVPPGKTLQETINQVLPSIKTDGAWGLDEQAKLAIPKIDFDLTAHFKELESKITTSRSRLNTVAENIVFRLNERGVELKAFATITETLGVTNIPPPRLVFDKPFLILLKRESSPRPYFAMWVGNPTLMVSP